MKQKISAILAIILMMSLIFISCDGASDLPPQKSDISTETEHPEVNAQITQSAESESETETEIETVTDTERDTETETEEHTHTYGRWTVTLEPTCVEEGEKTRTCKGCTTTQVKAIDPTGVHAWGEWVTAEEGFEVRNCEDCTAVESRIIPDADEILEVPASDFRGREVRILQRDTFAEEMYSAKENGEIINDAVYARNQAVEEYLGVTLKFYTAPGSSANYSQFERAIEVAAASGEDRYHIISNFTYQAPTMIQSGYFVDINALVDELNWLDVEKRWWNQSFMENSKIGNKQYLLAGDVTTSIFDCAEVMFYNNDMIKQYVGENVDILEVVYNREWTYEQFLNMIHKVGDGYFYGKWGFTAPANSHSIDGLIAGMAMDLTYHDGRYPQVKVDTARNLTIGERLRSLYQHDFSASCTERMTSELFSQGNSMFYMKTLSATGEELASSTVDYGVIPPPLYDGSQGEYRVISQDNFSSLSIFCHTGEALPAVTKTLEVMGAESYWSIRPLVLIQYLDTLPKWEMAEYTVEHLYFHFGYIYAKEISHPLQVLRNYARYPAGHTSYIESLTVKLEATEVSAVTKLEQFLLSFF